MLIRFNTRQLELLTRRAQLRGTSFSKEVSDAVDFYLGMPVDTKEELQTTSRKANRAADRMITRLDKTIAHVDSGLWEMDGRKRLAENRKNARSV